MTIGDNVYVQPTANICHDVVLEDGAFISSFCEIAGAAHVGRYSYVGVNSAVRELVKIGSYSIIGMGSAVHKDIPDEVVAFGNPAKIIKCNDNKRVFNH